MATLNRGRWTSTHGSIGQELFDAMSATEFLSMSEIVRASGRKAGSSLITQIVGSMLAHGLIERVTEGTAGASYIKYRKVADMFYNQLQDRRFQYRAFEELPMTVKQQALDRYEGHQEWLRNTDWLYPVTPGRVLRLARADRVLAISLEDAERRREEWRNKNLSFQL